VEQPDVAHVVLETVVAEGELQQLPPLRLLTFPMVRRGWAHFPGKQAHGTAEAAATPTFPINHGPELYRIIDVLMSSNRTLDANPPVDLASS
jgi:hypothetical protein